MTQARKPPGAARGKPPEERRKETLYREMTIDGNLDKEQRLVEVSFSSDVPYKRYDFWDGKYYEEVLSHEKNAIDLKRLTDVGVVLVNHDSRTLPVGVVESAWVEGASRGKAILRFDDDEAGEAVFQKVQKGIMRGVSVGYAVHEWELKKGEGGALDRETATRWEPLEISIVSVPADATVGVGRAVDLDEPDASPAEILEKKTGGQEVDKIKNDVVVEETINIEDVRSEGTRSERERIREIMEVCTRHGVDAVRFIEEGSNINDVRAAILDELATKQAATKVSSAHVEVDERDKFRDAVIDGMSKRSGLKTDSDERNDYAGMSFLMIADRCLTRAGDNRRGEPMAWLSRAMSTSDFPYICGAIANKALLEGWKDAPESWTQWCGVGSVPDFKPQTLVGIGAFGRLPSLIEGEEYKFTERVEHAETVKIGTFGQMFGLTRQTIINDDLSVFSDVMRELGAAAKRTIAALPYELLADNPVMGDGVVLFHGDHGNIQASSGANVNVDKLNEGVLKMAEQKDIGGKKRLGIVPRFLLAPVTKRGVFEQFFATELIGGVSNSPNIVNTWFKAGGLTVVYDHNLDDSGTNGKKAWYLAADKGRTVKVYFLNGVQTPYLESRDGWTVDGTEWKVRIDAAAAVTDYRGLYRNAGEA